MCSQKNMRKVDPRWPSLLGSHPLGMESLEQTFRLQTCKETVPWPLLTVNEQSLKGYFLKVQAFLMGAWCWDGVEEIWFEREERGVSSFPGTKNIIIIANKTKQFVAKTWNFVVLQNKICFLPRHSICSHGEFISPLYISLSPSITWGMVMEMS